LRTLNYLVYALLLTLASYIIISLGLLETSITSLTLSLISFITFALKLELL
ncbi:hypothetical protein BDW02DRAFT_619863, partial [Decorospora gaudefroyi]